MFSSHSALPPVHGPDDEASRFDRLVDGELTPEEYRELITSLDHTPDGWKRCALAFLEAQSFAAALGGAGRQWESSGPEPEKTAQLSGGDLSVRCGAATADLSLAAPAPQAGRTARGFSGRLRTALGLVATMAASFALAFTLGVAYRDSQARLRPDLAGGGKSRDSATAENTRPAPPASRLADSGRLDGANAPAAGPIREPGQELTPSGQLVFAVRDGGAEREVEVPVYDGRGLDRKAFVEWVARQQQATRPAWLEELQRAGHQVRTRRGLAPIDLRNGEEALAPFEAVEIVPVGRTYQ